MAFVIKRLPLFLALVAFFIQIRVASAVAGPIVQRACASIPGLTPNNIKVRQDIALYARQTTTTPSVSLAEIAAQDTPCIPPTVDTSSLNKGIQNVKTTDRAQAMGLGHFLKSVWKDVQDVIKVVKDVEAVLMWHDVVSILTLALDSWHLITDVTNTFIIAKSPDGKDQKTFVPTRLRPPLRDPPCGGNTRKMCPRLLDAE